MASELVLHEFLLVHGKKLVDCCPLMHRINTWHVFSSHYSYHSVPVNPLRPNSDLSQTSHCNIKGLSVRKVMRIENTITQVKFY